MDTTTVNRTAFQPKLIDAIRAGNTSAIGFFADRCRFRLGLNYEQSKALYEAQTGRMDWEGQMERLDEGYG